MDYNNYGSHATELKPVTCLLKSDMSQEYGRNSEL